MRKALAVAASIPWAIQPEWLATILRIANREGAGPEAVEAQLGRPLENTRTVTVRDGVAIIPVAGPIFRHADMFTAISGGTTIAALGLDLAVALKDPAVTGIVLNVDSPGGEVTGIHEFAEMVRAARGTKPIKAYIGGVGASAAYWIASAAEHVVADATARVGSIGIVMACAKPNAETADEIEIVSSQSPDKRPDVSTDQGRAVVQTAVDALAEVFVADVARYRNVAPVKVLSDFGRGSVLVGEGARAAGMVDELGSLESVIASMRANAPASPGATNRATRAVVATRRTRAMEITHKTTADAPQAPQPEAAPPPPPPEEGGTSPLYAAGDVVLDGEREATVDEMRDGPHYALTYADDGSKFSWRSEDELTPKPAADGETAALTATRRRLAAQDKEIAKLRGQLATREAAAKASEVAAILATGKAEKRLTPALAKALESIAPKLSAADLRTLVAACPTSFGLAAKAEPTPDGVLAGRKWEDFKHSELAALHDTNPALYQAIKADYDERRSQNPLTR